MFRLSVYNSNQHFRRTITGSRLVVADEVVFSKGDHPSGETVEVDDPASGDNRLRFDLEEIATPTTETGDDADRRIRISNRGATIVLPSGRRVFRGNQVDLSLPTRFQVGLTNFEVEPIRVEIETDSTLVAFDPASDDARSQYRAPSSDKLSLWFESISELQKLAAGSQAFFAGACRAACDPGGFDAAIVLRCTDGTPSENVDRCDDSQNVDWEIVASWIPSPELGISFRDAVAEKVASSKQTHFHHAEQVAANDDDSRQPNSALQPADEDYVVCAPIFGSDKQLTHLLYAVRSIHRSNLRKGIRPIEAQFVQVIADSLSSGLARYELESQTVRHRALLEQAFSPQVARRLQQDPSILQGTQRDVSVLFADVRNFTTIAKRVGSRVTFQFLSDVMDRLTDVIESCDGVVIDYMGDGLAAFWNAPLDQPQHAELACRAAGKILQRVPELNECWRHRLGQGVSIGIGINSGPAQVGNSGSRRRLKYGPRGNTVNLAQRIESATKEIGIPLLVSDATAKRLGPTMAARRVCSLKLIQGQPATGLYQLAGNQPGLNEHWLDDYAAALDAFETGDTSTAIHLLSQLVLVDDHDPAVDYLMRRIEQAQQLGRRVDDTRLIGKTPTASSSKADASGWE